MKIFWITLIIIIIFFVSSFYLTHLLDESTQEVVSIIEDMEESIQEKKWEEVNKKMDHLENMWGELSKPWKTFVFHEEINNVEISISRLREYINMKNEVLTRAELASIKYLIRGIYLDNKIELENIF